MKAPVQVIKCQIESCVHNTPDHFCDKRCINVCPCKPCDCDSVTNKDQSMCSDFEEKSRSLF